MATKAAYHHGNLRLALLDAADQVLQAEGLQGFTLRACARQAGVSHAAPKHHFGDVQGLLTAVAERGFERLVDRLEAGLGPVIGDLEAEMQATAEAYVGFAQSYPEHFRIMFRSDIAQFDMSRPPDAVVRTFTTLTNVILRQRGEDPIEPCDMDEDKSAALVNDIILGWCHVHGYAHLRLEGQLAMVPEETHGEQMALAAARLSGLLRGVGARAAG